MQSSDMTAPTRANQGPFPNGLPEKRGIRFNPHVAVQGESAVQWDIANGMKKLSLDDGGGAKDHTRGASSDSSADSAPIVTPIPGKEANDIHIGTTKKPLTFTPSPSFQAAGGPASQTRPANLPPGYPYRGPNAPVTLGGRDEILQVDYNLQPRHFIPSSIASSPAASVHSQPQPRATAANATSPPAAGAAAFAPSANVIGNPAAAAFYGQPGAYNGAPAAPPVDPAAANEVAQRIINNALQQAALITGNATAVPLNPALAATYANPQFMAGLYNPTLYGQAPSASPNPYYSASPGMPDPAVATALANAVATLPPAAFHAALQGFAGFGVPGATSPANPSAVGGPSANNRKLGLYKSELCRSWSETGSCRYGPKCQFAHGEDELRKVARHPKYKTEICRTFWVSGSCPYGKRCCFIHTEVPGGAAAKDGEAPTPTAAAAAAEGRARSQSTNSDPDQQTSMLARIKRQEPSSGTTGASTPPTSATGSATPSSATFARPSPAALRVDTSSLDSPNHTKESYPYTSNPALPAPGVPILRTDLSGGRRSPVPATAGPDFGRHNTAARLEVVGNSSVCSLGRDATFGWLTLLTQMPQTRTGPGHLRSVSQTFQTDQSSGRASPVVANGHLRSDSWSAASALVAPSSAIDPPARYRESKW